MKERLWIQSLSGSDRMNEEQKEISEQFAKNFGAKEFVRYGCAFTSLLLIGLALGMIFHNSGITIIFVVLSFGIIWLAPYWQPAYAILRKAMGNPNIPATLPRRGWKWWYYIPMAVKIAFLLIALKIGIQLLFQ